MRKVALSLTLFGTVLVPLLDAAPAHAQATRTWVSGVGDDVNPCSRTAPCKTFAGAISKTAAAGEIDCLDPGGFGALTITKSITVDCKGVTGGPLASLVNGIIVSSAAPAGTKVKLRNMTVQGAGNGINGVRYLAPGGAFTMENVEISGFATRGIDFQPSGNAEMFLSNVDISDVTNEGIFIGPSGAASAVATITNSRSHNNGAGLNVTGGTGLINIAIQGSAFAGNGGTGVAIAGAGAGQVLVTFDSSLSQANNAGISSTGANARVRVHQSIVTGNGTGLLTASSGQIISFSSNMLSGNITDGAPTSTVASQ